MKTRYLLEGRDEDGQWSWSNVSADGIKANATFDVRADAVAAMETLRRTYDCDKSEIRITELETSTTRYFARMTDRGIRIRGVESLQELVDRDDWREVADIAAHVNDLGIDQLDHGMPVDFTDSDQSYPQLRALFYSKD